MRKNKKLQTSSAKNLLETNMFNPIIISDLDGTLLNSRGCVSPSTQESISRWMGKGGKFIVATGRHYLNVKCLFNSWAHKPHLITSNGAMINDNLTLPINECLLSNIGDMVTLAAHYRVHFSVFTEAGWHITERNAMVDAYEFEAKLTKINEFSRLQAFKALFHGEQPTLTNLQQHLQSKYSDLHIVQSDAHWLEVQRKGINKFGALQRLLSSLNLSSMPTISFGDGLNDLELLSGCTQGVLMDNAMPALKALLPDLPVTLSNNEDGVRVYIEKFLS